MGTTVEEGEVKNRGRRGGGKKMSDQTQICGEAVAWAGRVHRCFKVLI